MSLDKIRYDTPRCRVFYHFGYEGPDSKRPETHPTTFMKQLAEERGFRILRSEPQPIADQWCFWIAYESEPDFSDMGWISKAKWWVDPEDSLL